MKPIGEQIKQKPWLGWTIFFGTMIIVFFLGLLASSIIERRAEAVFAYTPQVEHEQWEPRLDVWGMKLLTQPLLANIMEHEKLICLRRPLN